MPIIIMLLLIFVVWELVNIDRHLKEIRRILAENNRN